MDKHVTTTTTQASCPRRIFVKRCILMVIPVFILVLILVGVPPYSGGGGGAVLVVLGPGGGVVPTTYDSSQTPTRPQGSQSSSNVDGSVGDIATKHPLPGPPPTKSLMDSSSAPKTETQRAQVSYRSPSGTPSIWLWDKAPTNNNNKATISSSSTRTIDTSPTSFTNVPTFYHKEEVGGGGKSTDVFRVSSLPHPSCLAATLLGLVLLEPSSTTTTNNASPSSSVPLAKRSGGGGSTATKSTTTGPPWDLNSWHSYLASKSNWNCYKHGGHYNPGIARLGSEEVVVQYSSTTSNNDANNNSPSSSPKDDNNDEVRPIPLQLRTYGSHIIMRNVVYACGRLFTSNSFKIGSTRSIGDELDCRSEELLEGLRDAKMATFRYGHSFSMLAGNWPQPIAGTITLYHLKSALSVISSTTTSASSTLSGSGRGSDMEREEVVIGYWQPPTDYASHYHTLVEQVLPAFHALHTHDALSMGNHSKNDHVRSKNTIIITSRPFVLPHSMVKNNGSLSAETKLKGKFGGGGDLAVALARQTCFAEPKQPSSKHRGGGGEKELYRSSTYTTCIDSHLGKLFQSFAGTRGVVGLQPTHNYFHDPEHYGVGEASPPRFPDDTARGLLPPIPAIFEQPASSSSQSSSSKAVVAKSEDVQKVSRLLGRLSSRDRTVLYLDKLLVGNPTHCEPLWGPDPFFAESIAEDQYIRGIPPSPPSSLSSSTSSSPASYPPTSTPQFTTTSGSGSASGSFTPRSPTIQQGSWLRQAMEQPAIKNNNKQHQRSVRQLYDAFITSFQSCQRVHWAFREHTLIDAVQEIKTRRENIQKRTTEVVMAPASEESAATGNSKVIDTSVDGVHVVFTSREGDWARQLNEEAIIAAIEALFTSKNKKNVPNAPPLSNVKNPYQGATIRKVKFTDSKGSYHKLFSEAQLDVKRTTIFIGNHGANLIPSLYLRPNAGLITLSFDTPGFYPFSVFPTWLHVRDLHIEQACNKRLQKGKCKWSSGNNNDMVATEGQIRRIVEYVEEIVRLQTTAPRARPTTTA